eukprot:TRINITY_DN2300_c0_g1_i1.p1 TRINITY_DN2300_c0_g1~~TRINITY_DN2300_c0_g1_i1.p1  ORF type:complete len:314 (-),score=104.33 TRINITY_DN2300_c0_g1_i1:68-1009(-)
MSNKAAEAIVHSLSGSLAGIVALSVTYPLNVISTRMQVQSKSSHQQYSSVWDALSKIIAAEGVAGLFSGLPSGWIGTAATQGVYYYWYEFFRAVRGSNNRTLSTTENLLVASAAGALTATITNPIWVVNTRMTVKNTASETKPVEDKQQSNLFVTAYKIVREEGFLALYAGLFPALILVSNPTIQYAVFEYLKTVVAGSFKAKEGGRPPSFSALQTFLMAAFAKVIATVVTYPPILIKSKMQVAGPGVTTAGIATKILKDDGLGGFYKGLKTKIFGSVLNAALLLMCKDKIVVLLFGLFALMSKSKAQPAQVK